MKHLFIKVKLSHGDWMVKFSSFDFLLLSFLLQVCQQHFTKSLDKALGALDKVGDVVQAVRLTFVRLVGFLAKWLHLKKCCLK